MPDYILGLLTIPALAIVLAIVYVVINFAGYLTEAFLTQYPRFNSRVYAYRISAVSGHLSHQLIGAVFIERRNLGKKHTYMLTYDGTRATMATAERLPGGGKYRSVNDVDWDEETLETLDDFVNWRDHHRHADSGASS